MSGRLDGSAREAVEEAASLLDELPDLLDDDDVEWVPVPHQLAARGQFTGGDRRALGTDLSRLLDGIDPGLFGPGRATDDRQVEPEAVPRQRRHGLGLAALIPAAPGEGEVSTYVGPERRGAVRIDGRARLEADWLVTAVTRTLHHAALDDAQCADLAAHDGVELDVGGPLSLSCGRTVWAVARPNLIERAATTRCEPCCAALGYPDGDGSPQADPACEAVLLRRLAALP